MGAAERIEWSGEYPALLWSLHPCAGDEVWDAVEPVNDNARRLKLVERHSVPQLCLFSSHARAGRRPSTRKGGVSLPQRSEDRRGGGLFKEDVEVGLQYFGKRYLNPLLGRWVSADPLAIHAPGEADLNAYVYVSGHILKSVDPLGLDENSGCGAGDGCDVEPQESPTEETQANDTGTYGSGGASYNAPEEGQEAGTGQEGAPSTDTVKQGASGIVDVTPGMIAIGLINPVFGAALVVLGGAQTAQKDTAITPGTPEFEQASANGQVGFQVALSGLGGTASRAVTKSATRELGEASVWKLSQELDEIGQRVTQALETTGSEATMVAGGFGKLFAGGRTAKASELSADALRQGLTAQKAAGGPLKFVDSNGVVRLTIKQGSSRAPGSNFAHAEFRDAAGQRVDAFGNAVTRKSPGNHTAIDFDLLP